MASLQQLRDCVSSYMDARKSSCRLMEAVLGLLVRRVPRLQDDMKKRTLGWDLLPSLVLKEQNFLHSTGDIPSSASSSVSSSTIPIPGVLVNEELELLQLLTAVEVSRKKVEMSIAKWSNYVDEMEQIAKGNGNELLCNAIDRQMLHSLLHDVRRQDQLEGNVMSTIQKYNVYNADPDVCMTLIACLRFSPYIDEADLDALVG